MVVALLLTYVVVHTAATLGFYKMITSEHNKVVKELEKQKEEQLKRLEEMAAVHNQWAEIVERHGNELQGLKNSR